MSVAPGRSPTLTEAAMLRIPCPYCGVRDESEFRYRGDAGRARPAQGASPEELTAYVYERANPLGWHVEWWLHVGGCRSLLKLVRHTHTHAIHAVVLPHEEAPVPREGRP
jgi:heterotetrameric sarcosine oxidase delta subunit